MHEYSLMLAVLERVEEESKAHQAIAVHRVRLRIGDVSGVEADLLESAFEIVKAGTVCERAALEIERVPARWECSACGQPVGGGERLQCAACGAPARLASGGEILLGRIELEVP